MIAEVRRVTAFASAASYQRPSPNAPIRKAAFFSRARSFMLLSKSGQARDVQPQGLRGNRSNDDAQPEALQDV